MQRVQTTATMGRLPAASEDDALWLELDRGSGLWDNIPSTIRAAFKSLLKQQTEARSETTNLRQQLAAVELVKSETLQRLSSSFMSGVDSLTM